MTRKTVETPDAPKAIGPYSQAVECDGWIFCSGQIALDPATGQVVPGGVAEQTARVLENLRAVLAAAGSSLAGIVKTTVYLQDLTEFGEMNEVYAHYFPEDPPARATIQAARLPKEVRVEIDAIARAAG